MCGVQGESTEDSQADHPPPINIPSYTALVRGETREAEFDTGEGGGDSHPRVAKVRHLGYP